MERTGEDLDLCLVTMHMYKRVDPDQKKEDGLGLPRRTDQN